MPRNRDKSCSPYLSDDVVADGKASPCPRFFIKTAGYRRLIKKPSVRIGFSFYALIFTDFSAISLGNLMIMFVFIKKIGL
jgi:hypothetical protein